MATLSRDSALYHCEPKGIIVNMSKYIYKEYRCNIQTSAFNDIFRNIFDMVCFLCRLRCHLNEKDHKLIRSTPHGKCMVWCSRTTRVIHLVSHLLLSLFCPCPT